MISSWAGLHARVPKDCIGNVCSGNGSQCVAHWLMFDKSKVGVCPKHVFFNLMGPVVSKSEVHCVKCPAFSLVISK